MLSIAAATAATAAGDGTDAVTPQPRLVRAAHEFEAQMMKELMKPLTASNSPDGEEDGSSSGAGGALEEFASEALGRALSDHGGFGIASSIMRELSPGGNKPVTTRVTGNLHGNTVMSIHK
ncbi:MAG: hypothetical protein ABR906_02980 [Terracidiphilus sp.]|jgi:Rod binding domain-containing protein